MDAERREKLATLLAAMPERHRSRWCLSPWYGGCACLGCANGIEGGAGHLSELGYTYEEWREFFPEAPTLEALHANYRASAERLAARRSAVDGEVGK